MRVNSMSHHDFHLRNWYKRWNDSVIFQLTKLCRRCFPYINLHFFAKTFFQLGAAMCQALPSFFFFHLKKRSYHQFLFPTIFTTNTLTENCFLSTHNCMCSLVFCEFHLVSVGTSFSTTLQS